MFFDIFIGKSWKRNLALAKTRGWGLTFLRHSSSNIDVNHGNQLNQFLEQKPDLKTTCRHFWHPWINFFCCKVLFAILGSFFKQGVGDAWDESQPGANSTARVASWLSQHGAERLSHSRWRKNIHLMMASSCKMRISFSGHDCGGFLKSWLKNPCQLHFAECHPQSRSQFRNGGCSWRPAVDELHKLWHLHSGRILNSSRWLTFIY